MENKPRYLQNGDIQFPRRGMAPNLELNGYEVDEGDPYLFHLIAPPCKFRGVKKLPPCESCPTGKTVKYCHKFDWVGLIIPQCIDCASKGLNEP